MLAGRKCQNTVLKFHPIPVVNEAVITTKTGQIRVQPIPSFELTRHNGNEVFYDTLSWNSNDVAEFSRSFSRLIPQFQLYYFLQEQLDG